MDRNQAFRGGTGGGFVGVGGVGVVREKENHCFNVRVNGIFAIISGWSVHCNYSGMGSLVKSFG